MTLAQRLAQQGHLSEAELPRVAEVQAANPDRGSVYYEVVVEDEDLSMHPSVQLFRKYPTDMIAGTLIAPGDFVQTQT